MEGAAERAPEQGKLSHAAAAEKIKTAPSPVASRGQRAEFRAGAGKCGRRQRRGKATQHPRALPAGEMARAARLPRHAPLARAAGRGRVRPRGRRAHRGRRPPSRLRLRRGPPGDPHAHREQQRFADASMPASQMRPVTRPRVRLSISPRRTCSWKRQAMDECGYTFLPQHFLYFRPLPQGHWSLRPIFGSARSGALGALRS